MKEQKTNNQRRGAAVELAILFMLLISLLSGALILLTAYTQEDTAEYIRTFEVRTAANEIARDYVEYAQNNVDWDSRYEYYADKYPNLKVTYSKFTNTYATIEIKLVWTYSLDALYDDFGNLLRSASSQEINRKIVKVSLRKETRSGDTEPKYYVYEWNYRV